MMAQDLNGTPVDDVQADEREVVRIVAQRQDGYLIELDYRRSGLSYEVGIRDAASVDLATLLAVFGDIPMRAVHTQDLTDRQRRILEQTCGFDFEVVV